MLSDALLNSSVKRLSETLSKRYGCDVKFLPPTERVFSSHEYVIENNTAYIPLYTNDQFLGAAQINNQHKISSSNRKNIFDFIALILQSRLDFIESLEPHERQAYHRISLSNVIPFRSKKTNLFPVENKLSTHSPFIFSFLIESQNSEDIFKMAIEIHERTHRLAFVRIEDLDPTVFDSTKSITDLGNITVFINDLTRVSHDIQRKLIRYFDHLNSLNIDYETRREFPQFISGTGLSRIELRNDVRVFNELLPSLGRGYLKLSEPFSFYRSEKLLDFFFDSLTGQNST